MSTISAIRTGVLPNDVNHGVMVSPSAAAVKSSTAVAATQARSTIVSMDTRAASDVTYSKLASYSQNRQAWSNPVQDDISSIMALNSARRRPDGLAAQWRGLGGAVLSQFASNGTAYRQTLVNYDASAMGTGSAKELDEAALESFSSTVAKASLKVQTRSGTTVELTLAVDRGGVLGRNGLQVEIKASGSLSSAEKRALSELAQGLDKALEGLGQPDKPRMDIAGLASFDRSVLQSVDLSIKNPGEGELLSSFDLHLGSDRNAITYSGALGKVDVGVDVQMLVGKTSDQQRLSSITELLRQVDAAAQRSHADSRLVTLFKDAFNQLHTATGATGTLSRHNPTPGAIDPMLSGLADFTASFSGTFERTGRFGAVVETGSATYQFSQKTTLLPGAHANTWTLQQKQSESLVAQYVKSRGDVMLDMSSGNYDVFNVNDSTENVTTVTMVEGRVSDAQRSTEQNLLQTMKKLVNFKVEEKRETPVNRHQLESLQPNA
ncbi:hypothetical protein [Comamonas kerstersii]|uniref:Uncharacterized protein n=1 Tax=Comamonas kerstersii TaxID=225992 RepID=A0A6A1QY11_9BURK|nr:hypothetical protein [Comamonas kerstersii]KAB0583370.1 hypothetical protein F7P80_16600 [Comamonas kerstersii]QTW19996.1 hypothetical protein H8N02_06050 [Comamonas kerstersii]